MKSLSTEDLCKKLDRKAILFDTNVLLESAKQTEAFAEVFSFIQDCHCRPQYFSFIEFEFFARIYQEELVRERRKFLETLNIERLATNPVDDLIVRATKISHTYASRGKASPGITDCCILALLEKYEGNLFLLTANHKDFYPFLDRLFLCPVSFDDKIINLGFYRFNSKESVFNF